MPGGAPYELRDASLGRGVRVHLPSGEYKTVKVIAVSFTCDSRGKEKIDQKGGANNKLPCVICRLISMLREEGSTTCYPGGYVSVINLATSSERDDFLPCKV